MNPLARPVPPHPMAWPGPHGWPIASVIPYAGPVADSDTGGTGFDLAQIRTQLAAAGWLYCDGSPYACQDYMLLHAVIGTRFGSASEGGIAQFRVPDLRGRFIRGVDVPGNLDPGDRTTQDGAAAPPGTKVYGVGTLQADAFQGHEHLYDAMGPGEAVGASEANVLEPLPGQSTTGILVDPDDAGQSDGTPRSSTETRPLNLALNYLIRWAP